MDSNTAVSSKGILPMRFHARVWFLGLLLLLIVIAVFLILSSSEPAYHGKSASVLLEAIESQSEREESIAAFQALGKRGVSFLVDAIKQRPSALGRLVDEKLKNSSVGQRAPGLLAALPSARRAERRRGWALSMIAALGTNAASALPELMRQYNAQLRSGEKLIYDDVAEALLAMGDKKAAFVPDFMRAVSNNREPTACDGARLLASIGPKAQAAIPVLLAELPAGGPAFTNAVAEALWKIDRRTNFALAVFTSQLQSSRVDSLPDRLYYLREMGAAAEPAAPLVRQILLNSDDRAKDAAARTLREVGPALLQSTMNELNQGAPARIKSLMESIRHGGRNGIKAMRALAVYGPEALTAVPALVEVLQSSRARASNSTDLFLTMDIGFESASAADVLGEIGPEASSAVPELIAPLKERLLAENSMKLVLQYETVTSPCRALGNIGSKAAAAVPVLQALSQDNDPRFRAAAAAALARVAPQQAAVVVDVLRSLAINTNVLLNFQVALPARVALWRLGLEKEPPIQELVQALVQPWPWDAVQLLGDIGSPARSSIPRLELLLDAGYGVEVQEKRLVAIAIRKIDPKEAANLGRPGFLALP